jgi:hypothetical protein
MKTRARCKGVHIRLLSATLGEYKIIAGMRRNIPDPIGRRHPVIIRSAAVPGGNGRGEAIFEREQARWTASHYRGSDQLLKFCCP